MKNLISITLIAMLFLSSCMLTKNACEVCLDNSTDNIRSDTTYIIDSIPFEVEVEGETIYEYIDCENIRDTVIVDKATGLQLRIETVPLAPNQVRITTTQPTRTIRDTIVTEVPVYIEYNPDIAKYQAEKDSLINVIAKLKNKKAVKEKVNKWFQDVGFDFSKWFTWLWFILSLVALYIIYRGLKWLIEFFKLLFGN